MTLVNAFNSWLKSSPRAKTSKFRGFVAQRELLMDNMVVFYNVLENLCSDRDKTESRLVDWFQENSSYNKFISYQDCENSLDVTSLLQHLAQKPPILVSRWATLQKATVYKQFSQQ